MPIGQLENILIRNVKLRLLKIDSSVAAVVFVECEQPVFAVILDTCDETRESRSRLVISLVFIANARRTHIHLQLQTMERMSPRQHLRIDKSFSATDAESGNVNVVIDQLRRIDVVERAPDQVRRLRTNLERQLFRSSSEGAADGVNQTHCGLRQTDH